MLPAEPDFVNVSAKNLIFFVVQPDGRVVVRRGESEQEQTIPHAQVGQTLRNELKLNTNLIVAIQTHPDASYRHMINVLDEVKFAGADRISLQELGN